METTSIDGLETTDRLEMTDRGAALCSAMSPVSMTPVSSITPANQSISPSNNEVSNNEVSNNEVSNNEVSNNEVSNNEVSSSKVPTADTRPRRQAARHAMHRLAAIREWETASENSRLVRRVAAVIDAEFERERKHKGARISATPLAPASEEVSCDLQASGCVEVNVKENGEEENREEENEENEEEENEENSSDYDEGSSGSESEDDDDASNLSFSGSDSGSDLDSDA